MIGYHFTDNTLRDGQPIPPIGEWLVHEGDVIPCKSGLHASEHPFDALRYAPGNLLHKVELSGDLQPHGDPTDKWIGRQRRIIATIDATDILREFACWCALQVIHLWEPPQVVIDYLNTRDEALRDAARAAAWDTAWHAAWDAARDAAWHAARDAAWDAAWDAAVAAARDAARDAAVAAAGDAAGDAEEEKQRRKFAEMIEMAFINTDRG